MDLIYIYYSIISILVSMFAYFFCTHIADTACITLPFFSKKIKINRNSQKIIKFDQQSTLFNEKFFIKSPKYYSFSSKLFYTNINNDIKDKISHCIDTNKKTKSNDKLSGLTGSSVNAFLNNKFILSLLKNKLDKLDLSNILNILSTFQYPINVILKFYNNCDSILFYIKDSNIIKINNCETYNEIIDFVFNSAVFVVCNDENHIYISNGFLINHKINNNSLSDLFGDNKNNKYYQSLNKFDHLSIIFISSTLNTLNPC
jgi:hypothetical protein